MKKIVGLAIALLYLLPACKKEKSAEIEPAAFIAIRFHPTFNNLPVQLNTPYTNAFGEEFAISTLKFYTGQFSLTDLPIGITSIASGGPYYLADYSNPSSLNFTAAIKPGSYNELSFLTGVDSTRNVSGIQSGALDPANGMFWTWNSGYIFFKLEGNSPVSTQPNGKIEYHIGGFQSPASAIRKYTGQLTGPDKWVLGIGQTISFDINIAIDRFFTVPFPLKIVEIPVCTTPGELASDIADNIVSAFEVTKFEIN